MDSQMDDALEVARAESEIDYSYKPDVNVYSPPSVASLQNEQHNNNSVMDGQDEEEQKQVYGALVIDSGPIIRLTGLSTLRDRGRRYYTVPGVLQEIRDAKARDHLDQLPFDLVAREASAEGIYAVTQFARQTGDYHSLSAVDLHVLALVYDLEREGCEGNIDHIRTTPKRKIGLGKVEFLNGKNIRDNEEKNESGESKKTAQQGDQLQEPPAGEPQPAMHQPATAVASNTPKTWAFIVNPSAASATPPVVHVSENVFIVAKRENNEVNDVAAVTAQLNAADLGGQFSDAEESDHDDDSSDEESTDDDGYADPEKEISDEECDVYILDPEEVDERNRDLHGLDCTVEEELMSDFPSLAASLHVPYEGDDVDGVVDAHKDGGSLRPLTEEEVGERKKQALTPLSKSGKLYNSFPKYSNLLKPKATATKENFAVVEPADGDHETEEYHVYNLTDDANGMVTHSRIIGGAATSGQELEVEDDGEGWITCSRDIQKMKASGTAFPTRGSKGPHGENTTSPKPVGPPIWKRAACATTDFAIQNVILQMNLELLSVDGVKIRRLKSWILRCGACFTVHADGDGVGPLGTRRLFCSRCGSDMMQRISASVDGKSGRLRLHLSQRHKNNLRGTKFSLPKPGTGNRFQGDLLLREDQLLTGAWNQKVKMMTGGKARRPAQSMFGSDLASTVGCNASAVTANDIKVGFGRRNPNAAKGRERRGKKEKSSDKACGLRRY